MAAVGRRGLPAIRNLDAVTRHRLGILRGEAAFKQAVDESLMAMMKSGEMARLYDKWFIEPIPPTNKPLGLPASDATRAAWAHPNDKPVEDYTGR